MINSNHEEKHIIKRFMQNKENYLRKPKKIRCIFCNFLKLRIFKFNKKKRFSSWLNRKCKCKNIPINLTSQTIDLTDSNDKVNGLYKSNDSNLNAVQPFDPVKYEGVTFVQPLIKKVQSNQPNIKRSKTMIPTRRSSDLKVTFSLKKNVSLISNPNYKNTVRSQRTCSSIQKTISSSTNLRQNCHEQFYSKTFRKDLLKSMSVNSKPQTTGLNNLNGNICFQKSILPTRSKTNKYVEATLVDQLHKDTFDPIIFQYENEKSKLLVKVYPEEENLSNFIKNYVGIRLDTNHSFLDIYENKMKLNDMKKSNEFNLKRIKSDDSKSKLFNTTQQYCDNLVANETILTNGDSICHILPVLEDKINIPDLDVDEERKIEVKSLINFGKEIELNFRTEKIENEVAIENKAVQKVYTKSMYNLDLRSDKTLTENTYWKSSTLQLLSGEILKYDKSEYNEINQRKESCLKPVPNKSTIPSLDSNYSSSHLGIICYLCGNLYSTYSIHIHYLSCRRRWERASRILGKDISIPKIPHPKNEELESRLFANQNSIKGINYTMHDAYNDIMREASNLNETRYKRLILR